MWLCVCVSVWSHVYMIASILRCWRELHQMLKCPKNTRKSPEPNYVARVVCVRVSVWARVYIIECVFRCWRGLHQTQTHAKETISWCRSEPRYTACVVCVCVCVCVCLSTYVHECVCFALLSRAVSHANTRKEHKKLRSHRTKVCCLCWMCVCVYLWVHVLMRLCFFFLLVEGYITREHTQGVQEADVAQNQGT